MRRVVASGLVAVAVLASVAVGDAGSAPRALRLVGHWGEPTLPIPNIDVDSDARGMSSSSGSIWNTAVAPGGRFALLHVDSSSVGNDLLLLALPEARIVHVLPAPQVRIEAQSFALSADGRWGLFSGDGNEALVWDIGRARETGRLKGAHTARVSATAIAPNGRAAITGDERGGVALWSMPDRKLRHRFSVEHDANAVAFSPDGRRGIAVGRHVVMFDVATGKELLTMYGHGPFDRVAFTPDGKRVVLASAYNHVMTVSDAATGRLLQLRKQDPVPREMAMAPDGRSVLGEGSFALGRWMLDDLAKVDKLGDYGGVGTGIGVAAGGRVFFTTDEDGELKWWDTATGNRRVSRHERALTALAWTPDGGTLIAGASDGTLSFWSASGKRLRESTRHAHAVSGIAIAPDGKLAVSVAGDGMAWPLPRGPEHQIGGDDGVELEWAAFSADGKRMVVGGVDGSWASAAVERPASLSAKSCETGSPGGVAVALDGGKALLVSGDGDGSGDAVSRVDLAACKRVWAIDGVAGVAPAVSPDGKTVLVAPGRGAMQLHGLADGALIRSFQLSVPAPSVPARRRGKHRDYDDDDDDDGDRRGTYTTAVGFLADKDQAMSADSAGGITVWDLTTGKAIGHNADARRRKSFGTVIAARPGSHTVAVGTSRGEILLFAP